MKLKIKNVCIVLETNCNSSLLNRLLRHFLKGVFARNDCCEMKCFCSQCYGLCGKIWLMKILEFLSMLVASILPSPTGSALEPGVTVEISPGSSLVAEEQVQIRVGDKFSAVIMNPETKEIYSQSDWIEVKK